MDELPFCECGCGERVTKKGNRFIWGHNWQGKKHDLKSIKKMVGHKSPDHCKAISEGQKKSDTKILKNVKKYPTH